MKEDGWTPQYAQDGDPATCQRFFGNDLTVATVITVITDVELVVCGLITISNDLTVLL